MTGMACESCIGPVCFFFSVYSTFNYNPFGTRHSLLQVFDGDSCSNITVYKCFMGIASYLYESKCQCDVSRYRTSTSRVNILVFHTLSYRYYLGLVVLPICVMSGRRIVKSLPIIFFGLVGKKQTPLK